MTCLEHLRRSDAFNAFDIALAEQLHQLAPDTDAMVLTAAALASQRVRSGDAAFALAAPPPINGVTWPSFEAWQTALQASPWVDCPDAVQPSQAHCPLVLENGLLYLRRYREYERQLAADLQRVAASQHTFPRQRGKCPQGDGGDTLDGGKATAALTNLINTLYPPNQHDPHQRAAALAALDHRLCLISGGPGTGKTTTIANALVLLSAQAQLTGGPAPRIALAAPTGRAADRMAASLRNAAAQLQQQPNIHNQWLEVLSLSAKTLHRLLGIIPDNPQPRFNAHAPLPLDVLVVDEASMIDLPLMAKLLAAMPTHARLLLLGDPDQLPSVETGDVLASMVKAADAAAQHNRASALHHARLHTVFRQDAGLELAELAQAVREGASDTAIALLQRPLQGVQWHQDNEPLLSHTRRDSLLAPWRELLHITDPIQALAQASHQRVLTALRRGAHGADTLNTRIEDALLGERRPAYFNGRLLMILDNSPRHGLYNGDIGVCLTDAAGRTQVWFEGAIPEQPRAFAPSQLPRHSSAWASTVHKSQGSEFANVWLVLPPTDARVLMRELIYTAITRARRHLHVISSEATLRTSLSRQVQRHSGLQWRLGV